MGLNRNGLGDLVSSDVTRLLGYVLPETVESVDFSANKFATLDFSLEKRSLNRLNFEKNLIGSFNISAFLQSNPDLVKAFELNLAGNFIKDVSVENFRVQSSAKAARISVKLRNNPLMCDCKSTWLLDEMRKLKLFKSKASTRKFVKSNNENNNNAQQTAIFTENRSSNKINNEASIKLVFKREIEEISSHHNLNDPNFAEYMQRQKRIKNQQQQEFDQSDQTWVRI